MDPDADPDSNLMRIRSKVTKIMRIPTTLVVSLPYFSYLILYLDHVEQMEETVARKRAELAARDAKLLALNQVFAFCEKLGQKCFLEVN